MKSKKSKKSDAGSKRRDRSWSRSPSEEIKSKRAKPFSKSGEKPKTKEETKTGPRKTRWQAAETTATLKIASPSSSDPKPVKSESLPQIKDLLHDKEKILDLLFRRVTGAALRELIPDYLKKRSIEDLKKLCLEQIKVMTDAEIIQVVSGNVVTNNEEKKIEKQQETKTEQPDASKDKEKENTKISEKKPVAVSSSEGSDNTSSDVLELHTTTTEMESVLDEGQIPIVVKDEVAKDLITPERDAELLELEMRARAIRALLRSKTQKEAEEVHPEKKE